MLIVLFVSAQLWKYDSNTKKLENKNGDWVYMNKKWNIPGDDSENYIEDSDSNVLGLKDDVIKNDTSEVILQAKVQVQYNECSGSSSSYDCSFSSSYKYNDGKRVQTIRWVF